LQQQEKLLDRLLQNYKEKVRSRFAYSGVQGRDQIGDSFTQLANLKPLRSRFAGKTSRAPFIARLSSSD
jgi:hypothetical protein